VLIGPARYTKVEPARRKEVRRRSGWVLLRRLRFALVAVRTQSGHLAAAQEVGLGPRFASADRAGPAVPSQVDPPLAVPSLVAEHRQSECRRVAVVE